MGDSAHIVGDDTRVTHAGNHTGEPDTRLFSRLGGAHPRFAWSFLVLWLSRRQGSSPVPLTLHLNAKLCEIHMWSLPDQTLCSLNWPTMTSGHRRWPEPSSTSDQCLTKLRTLWIDSRDICLQKIHRTEIHMWSVPDQNFFLLTWPTISPIKSREKITIQQLQVLPDFAPYCLWRQGPWRTGT